MFGKKKNTNNDQQNDNPADLSHEFETVKESVANQSTEEKNSESLDTTIKQLTDELTAKTEEAKTNLDGWQRSRAELANKEKQLVAERAQIYKNATAHVLEELIPVLDSYEMARKNKQSWESVDPNWRVGVEYIFSQMEKVLFDNGLEIINVKVGDQFDVNTMQAVEEVITEVDSEDHKVSEIIQTGYRLNGKTLRETRVKIFVKK
mgnify:CR=1 FL=1